MFFFGVECGGGREAGALESVNFFTKNPNSYIYLKNVFWGDEKGLGGWGSWSK